MQKRLEELRKFEELYKATICDFELETISTDSPENYIKEKKKREKKRIEAFQKAIDKSINNVNQSFSNLILALKLSGDKFINCPLIQGDIKKLPEELKTSYKQAEEDEIILTFKKARDIYYKAISNIESISFRFKNNWLELTIRILMELIKKNPDEKWQYSNLIDPGEVYFILADSYFRRGKSILPKGKGVSAPEKKLEAMKKSLHWCNTFFSEIDKKTDTNILNFTELYVQVVHELFQMDKITYKQNFKEALERFINLKIEPKTALQYYIVSLYCNEFPNNSKLDQKIFNMPFDYETTSLKTNYPGLMLAKLQAVFRLVTKGELDRSLLKDEINVFISMFKDQKNIELFSPIWDDILFFIKKLLKAEYEEWQELALETWQICHNKEQLLSFGLQIRQYWSRLDDLYHMAIQAAFFKKDLKKAAEIIDSIKGRSQVTWSDMDIFLLNRKDKQSEKIKALREQYYQMEAHAAMGIYDPDYNQFRKGLLSKVGKKSFIKIDKIPSGFTSIHFYLDETMTCHAVCGYASDSNDVKWEIHSIEFSKTESLWLSFKKWKEAYLTGTEKERYESLNELCNTLGEIMSFLFEIAEYSKGIIFVPHGFLHQIPLHAALNKDKNPLFSSICCTYLPAWSLASDNEQNQSLEGNCLLRYFEKDNEKNVTQDILNNKDWTYTKDDFNKEDMDNFIETLKDKAPEILCLLCHGEADKVNPFNSKLKFGNGGLSCLDLQMASLNIKGTNVILAACETELTPEYNRMIDEHISIAGTFLTKKAACILGSLWECSAQLISEIISENFRNNASLLDTLQKMQSSWFMQDHSKLYEFAPFKIIGYPI